MMYCVKFIYFKHLFLSFSFLCCSDSFVREGRLGIQVGERLGHEGHDAENVEEATSRRLTTLNAYMVGNRTSECEEQLTWRGNSLYKQPNELQVDASRQQ